MKQKHSAHVNNMKSESRNSCCPLTFEKSVGFDEIDDNSWTIGLQVTLNLLSICQRSGFLVQLSLWGPDFPRTRGLRETTLWNPGVRRFVQKLVRLMLVRPTFYLPQVRFAPYSPFSRRHFRTSLTSPTWLTSEIQNEAIHRAISENAEQPCDRHQPIKLLVTNHLCNIIEISVLQLCQWRHLPRDNDVGLIFGLVPWLCLAMLILILPVSTGLNVRSFHFKS